MTENEILKLSVMNGIKIDPMMFSRDSYRLKAYRVFGYSEKAFNDKFWKIRREAHRRLGYTEKAIDDEHWKIRLEAYRVLGYTEKAFDDDMWDIRLEAYRRLGFTEKAFDDERWDIRRDAKKYFELKTQIKNKGEAKAMIDVWKLEQL